MVSLVVAVAQNGVIGKDNDLPWYLPADLKRFKDITTGHPVIMGRKTYESIVARLGHALPNRTNIVVTSQSTLASSDAVPVPSLAAAIDLAGTDDAYVIGGARLFAEALPIADRVYLTEVKAAIDGDVSFPDFDATLWREIDRSSHPADEKNQYPYDFVTYERIT